MQLLYDSRTACIFFKYVSSFQILLVQNPRNLTLDFSRIGIAEQLCRTSQNSILGFRVDTRSISDYIFQK